MIITRRSSLDYKENHRAINSHVPSCKDGKLVYKTSRGRKEVIKTDQEEESRPIRKLAETSTWLFSEVIL